MLIFLYCEYGLTRRLGFRSVSFLCQKSFLLDSAPIYHNKYRAKLQMNWSEKRKGWKYRPAQKFVSGLANRTPLISAIAKRRSTQSAASYLLATECDDAYAKSRSRHIRSADAACRICRRLQRPTQSAECATQPVWRRGRACWERTYVDGYIKYIYLI